jgi:hypothetical protein
MDIIMKVVILDIKRFILSKNMILAILLGLFCILLGMLFEPIKSAIKLYSSELPYEAKVSLIGNSFNKVTLWYFGNWFYATFMPLISCIPYTIKYLQDKKTGFSKYIIIRSNYKNYIFSKVISVFLSGFITIMIINIIYFIALTLMDSGDMYRSLFYENTPFSEISTSNFNLFFIIHSIICSIMGGVYASIGLAISSLVDKTLMAFVSPFAIYYLGTYALAGINSAVFSPSIVNLFYIYPGLQFYYIPYQLFGLFVISMFIFLLKTYWSDNFD